MSRLASLVLIAPLVGIGCLPRAPEAAVRLEVTYGFKAGCITVQARDSEHPDREDQAPPLQVFDRGPSTVVFAVYRQEGWSHTMEIVTSAHEKTCSGPVVAQEVKTVTLQKKGAIEQLAITLDAPDEDNDGYIATAANGSDCDDGDESRRPDAQEVCDNKDNNCDGFVDQAEGLGSPWYPDRDGDNFGDKDAPALWSCFQPEASGDIKQYVKEGTDCRDSDSTVFPRAKELRCDDVDDDCDGKADEDFADKGKPCTASCPGTYVCNANYTGLTCNAPSPTLYYPDADGDGAGNEDSTGVAVCPGATPPAGHVTNKDDCDDKDEHNRRGRAEVCDDRDNTCDMDRDEGNVCGGKEWKVLNDPALSGNRQWRTVAMGPSGLPVWVAGEGGVLAVRTTAGQPFKSLDKACGSFNWRAAWVRPSDGHVFLAGDGGHLAEHDNSTCSNQTTTTTSTNDLSAIQGFPGTTQLYVVDRHGRMYVWTPGSATQERYNENGPTYYGLHGLSSTQLLAVGDKKGNNTEPYIVGYTGSGGLESRTEHTLSGLPLFFSSALRAVWMANASLAYAVGDSGLVMTWNGSTGWTKRSAPPGSDSVPFSSVVVLDPSSIYITDASANGAIRRLSGTGWTTAFTTDKPLRDIALNSPQDIWAVGDDGRVVHFPE